MTTTFNSVRAIRGHYNFAHPTEEQVQYEFRLRPDAPQFNRRGWSIDLDYEFDVEEGEPLAAINELIEVYQKHYLSNAEKDLYPLQKYLESMELDDRIDYAREQHEKYDALSKKWFQRYLTAIENKKYIQEEAAE